MQKLHILPILLLLLLLTGCWQTDDKPVESTDTTQIPDHSDDTASDVTTDQSQETTNSSIEATTGGIDVTPENPGTQTDHTPVQTTGGSIGSTEDPENNKATEDPEETLNKILNELHELDELMNGA